jgi:hypothetical protein
MRNFETLDSVTLDSGSGIIHIATQSGAAGLPRIAMRREGSYVAISASYGPLEIALRPRFAELARILGRLRPVEGLQTTRQVGTGQAYLSLGLQVDGMLVMRPTIVADATGHLCFNLLLSSDARQQLFDWLPVEVLSDDE